MLETFRLGETKLFPHRNHARARHASALLEKAGAGSGAHKRTKGTKRRRTVKTRLAGILLVAGLAFGAGAARADATAGNLRLMAFGGDAQLTAVKHAVA